MGIVGCDDVGVIDLIARLPHVATLICFPLGGFCILHARMNCGAVTRLAIETCLSLGLDAEEVEEVCILFRYRVAFVVFFDRTLHYVPFFLQFASRSI